MDNKPVMVLKPVHVKTLHQLEKLCNFFYFEIRKGKEMLSNFSSHQVVNSIQINNRPMEKDKELEEWTRQHKQWRLNETECMHPTARILTKDYLSEMFFIKDNLLWVRVQTKGEPTRVCVVIPRNQIHETLKDEHGTLFDRHDGVAKTRFNLTKKYWWPCMDKNIANFLKKCVTCQKIKLSQNNPTNLLTLLSTGHSMLLYTLSSLDNMLDSLLSIMETGKRNISVNLWQHKSINLPGCVAGCRAPTANEFQNL